MEGNIDSLDPTLMYSSLTLTEASYAYLMEPHWYYFPPTTEERFADDKTRNPTIEEQALARIHRIGQKKEVTTIRFFVKDTFEEASSYPVTQY